MCQTIETNKGLPSLNKQLPLIVKPKETQSYERTKEEFNKINPDNLKITNVKSRSSRIIVIQSENCEDREKIKSAIEEKISKQYEIKILNSTGLNSKLFGVF